MATGTYERYTDSFDYEPPEPHYITLALDVCALLLEYQEAALDDASTQEQVTLPLERAVEIAYTAIEQSGHMLEKRGWQR
jgi:hypothetical protein